MNYCPICKSTNIMSNGSHQNKKKFKCRICGKHFINENYQTKRGIIISDTHCGHKYGLTPPAYWTHYDENAFRFQKESWTWYNNVIEKYKPFDICIANGDLIDGRGEKSGGTELLTADRNQQVKIASEIINVIGSNTVLIARGTDYHVGREEQFEDKIAELTGANEIADKLRFRINGVLFDVRHHTGNTTVPWSEFTASVKELVLANIERGEDVNFMIRSHVHRYTCSQIGINQTVITTPGLEGHTRFGSKKCIGRVNFGCVVFDISNDGILTITPILAELDSLKYHISEY